MGNPGRGLFIYAHGKNLWSRYKGFFHGLIIPSGYFVESDMLALRNVYNRFIIQSFGWILYYLIIYSFCMYFLLVDGMEIFIHNYFRIQARSIKKKQMP